MRCNGMSIAAQQVFLSAVLMLLNASKTSYSFISSIKAPLVHVKLSRNLASLPDFQDESFVSSSNLSVERENMASRPRAARRVVTSADLERGFIDYHGEKAVQTQKPQSLPILDEGNDLEIPEESYSPEIEKIEEQESVTQDTAIELKWYVLQVYRGSELFAQKIIKKKLDSWGLNESIQEVMVPVKKVPNTVGKKIREKNIPIYPGYVYCKVKMTQKIRDLLRGLPRVVGFLGQERDDKKIRIPDPILQSEVDRILSYVEETEAQPSELTGLKIGDIVQITDGTYTGEIGVLYLVRSNEYLIKINTYGTQSDLKLPFNAVRKLTEEEIARETANIEAAETASYKDQNSSMLPSLKRVPRSYDDFGDMKTLNISPREQRRERAWKKDRMGAVTAQNPPVLPRSLPRRGQESIGMPPRGAPSFPRNTSMRDSQSIDMPSRSSPYNSQSTPQRGSVDRKFSSSESRKPSRDDNLFKRDLNFRDSTLNERRERKEPVSSFDDETSRVDSSQDDFFAALMEELKSPLDKSVTDERLDNKKQSKFGNFKAFSSDDNKLNSVPKKTDRKVATNRFNNSDFDMELESLLAALESENDSVPLKKTDRIVPKNSNIEVKNTESPKKVKNEPEKLESNILDELDSIIAYLESNEDLENKMPEKPKKRQSDNSNFIKVQTSSLKNDNAFDTKISNQKVSVDKGSTKENYLQFSDETGIEPHENVKQKKVLKKTPTMSNKKNEKISSSKKYLNSSSESIQKRAKESSIQESKQVEIPGSKTQPEIKKMKIPELKDELRARGLKVGGSKEELVERLVGAMAD